MLVRFKNTWLAPIDVGGRLLAVGEPADLDPSAPAVAEHVERGHLTQFQGAPSVAAKQRSSEEI